MDGSPVAEPVDGDQPEEEAEGGAEPTRRAMTIGIRRRWCRHGWSGGGPSQWRNGRVGPLRRGLIDTATRVESWLWTVLGRPLEVGGQVRTPAGTIRWDLAVAAGWVAVRLPGVPRRFSDLGEIQGRGSTQVSGNDLGLFCVLALSDAPPGGSGDDQPVASDGVVVDTELRLRTIRLRVLGILAPGRSVDELYDEQPPQVAGWQRVHALDRGDLWIGVFCADPAG